VAYLFARFGEKIFFPGLYRSVPALDPAFLSAMEEFKRKFSGTDEKKRGERVRFLMDEFGPTPELQKIGTEFVSNLEAEISPDELDSKIQTAAVEYYRQLWDTLSNEEKLVLAQLAHEGLVNPKNRMLVARLMNKGIILRDPCFRLMNSSFARFVLAAVSPEIMNEWERAGLRLPWRTIRFVLLGAVVIVGIFLYVSQQALFEGMVGYVGAIAAAIAGLVNVFGIFKGAPSAQNPAK
jgi:hypothetical protein